jgi:hypothetical protein
MDVTNFFASPNIIYKYHERKKKGKKKRGETFQKMKTLSICEGNCEGKIPLDIVLSRNNRNFLP